MTKQELIEAKMCALEVHNYQLHFWKGWNYPCLKKLCTFSRKRGKNHEDETYSDCIIMADTETSKAHENAIETIKGETKYIPVVNYIVAFTISLRIYNHNIVTLWGNNPEDFCKCLDLIMKNLSGDKVIVYFHNLAYDYTFLEKFLFKHFGEPESLLATKPHYPINIRFNNGLILKDSLILAQRSLDRWAKDMEVEHQKAKGLWDYDKIRNQNELFTSEELEYIEHDTLAGVECIEKTMTLLNKNLLDLPLTATGIPREQTVKRGAKNRAKDRFNRMAPELEVQSILELVFHGGFTHANRHVVNQVQYGITQCYDFASSYPYQMISQKIYPCEKFTKIPDCTPEDILEASNDYAFIFKLIMYRPMLKEYDFPMPALQFSKATKVINPILDNGRILGAEYVEIYLNEIDLEVIYEQYNYNSALCRNIYFAKKDYLPRWFTDYLFELFTQKTMLKGDDNNKVLYALKKAELNSCYGMSVQKPLRDEIKENYETGEYFRTVRTAEEINEEYEKYLHNRNRVLPFQWGCWVTSGAFRSLFKLGKCVNEPAKNYFYSDTDSIYAQNWNLEKLEAYNKECKEALVKNGYGAVIKDSREYWLGVAEPDSTYSEFMVQGAKRYCGRSTKDNEIHITVAGVPKAGAKCLKDDIRNFRPEFIFDGLTTGKKMHTYLYESEIRKDSKGNLIANSIDLTPCDYKLDGVQDLLDWQNLISEAITIQVYE